MKTKYLLLGLALISLSFSSYSKSPLVEKDKQVRIDSITKNKQLFFEYRFYKNDLVKIQVVKNVINVYVGWKRMDEFAQQIYEKNYNNKNYHSITRDEKEHENKHFNLDEIEIRHYHLKHNNKNQIDIKDLTKLLVLLQQKKFLLQEEVQQCLKSYQIYCENFQNKLSAISVH